MAVLDSSSSSSGSEKSAKSSIFPGWGLDGDVLHGPKGVAPEMWCVTREDLQHFRACVEEAVTAGAIKPIQIDQNTGRGDPFDPLDKTIGPDMYNVVHSYIKPVTLQAGKMSWALLRRPEGTKCDFFITHSWAEGVYEFIDKVLASWPRGKIAAWCCIFANPQCLDINALVCEPRSSPFAKALQCATHMMVVSNSRVSIYTRIWCVYEAYLAYIWDKVIFTAVAPNSGERWVSTKRILASLLFGILIGICCVSVVPHGIASLFLNVTFIMSVLLACTSQASSRPRLVWQFVNLLGMMITAASLYICIAKDSDRKLWGHCGMHYGAIVQKEQITCLRHQVCLMFIHLAFFILAEVDRLRIASIQREACQLACYSSISDAGSSAAKDKCAILHDVGDQVHAVDKSIGVLLAAGMSTNQLRIVAERGIDVSGAAEQRLALGWVGLSIWCYTTWQCCTWHDSYGEAHYLPEFYLSSCCIIFYIISWAFAEADKRAFLMSSLPRLFVCLILPEGLYTVLLSRTVYDYFNLAIALHSILVVFCTSAGLSGLAKIPYIGKCLVGTLAPGCRACKCFNTFVSDRDDDGDVSSESEDVMSDDSSNE